MKQVADSETREILQLAEASLATPGDFVELGCYEGDTSLLLAELIKTQKSDKKLWIYDSFEGLPAKSKEDESAAGVNFQAGALGVTKREVKLRFLRANLPVPIIKKAWFADLTEEDLPAKISFAFFDGDFYQSIKDSFKAVEGKMAAGGIIIVHDYNNPELPGVTKAVDECAVGKKIVQKDTLAIIKY